ncbi:ABC transporter substrate-binding protein [Streptomyces gardneri]|nr:ABC transporter substrate-binding protein [Streptomyces gardneri]
MIKSNFSKEIREMESAMRTKVKTALVGMTVAGLVTAMTACSDGGGGSDGSTIKVMAMGQYQSSQFSFPEMKDAVEGAINAANAAGGINGKKIELTTCNDQGDPNVAAKCARQAVTEHAAAVLGSISLFNTGVTPVLEAAHIPLIGALPLTSADFTSPISYPADGGNPGQFTAAGLALAQRGCKQVGIISSSDSAAAQVSAELIEQGVKSGGGQVTSSIGVTSDAPDLAPAVSTLLQGGARCVGVALPAAAQMKFIMAARQSSNPQLPIAASLANVPPSVLASSGAAMEGVLLPDSKVLPNPTDTPNFVAQLKAQNPKAEVDTSAELAWSAATVFIEVAKQIQGPVTASSVIDQLKKTTAMKLETYPSPIDFTKENSNPKYKRLFNTKDVMYMVHDGAIIKAQNDLINVADALAAS